MIRLAAVGFMGWCAWRWAVSHPHLLPKLVDRFVELGFFLAPLMLVLIVYRRLHNLPVVW